jgi:hypothetical protein
MMGTDVVNGSKQAVVLYCVAMHTVLDVMSCISQEYMTFKHIPEVVSTIM